MILRKAVFQLAKGGLLPSERRPFAARFAAFCRVDCKVLTVSLLRIACRIV